MAAQPGLRGEAFNFSNELQVTVLELVQRILSMMNSDLTPDIRNEACNEIPHQALGAAKARRFIFLSSMILALIFSSMIFSFGGKTNYSKNQEFCKPSSCLKKSGGAFPPSPFAFSRPQSGREATPAIFL